MKGLYYAVFVGSLIWGVSSWAGCSVGLATVGCSSQESTEPEPIGGVGHSPYSQPPVLTITATIDGVFVGTVEEKLSVGAEATVVLHIEARDADGELMILSARGLSGNLETQPPQEGLITGTYTFTIPDLAEDTSDTVTISAIDGSFQETRRIITVRMLAHAFTPIPPSTPTITPTPTITNTPIPSPILERVFRSEKGQARAVDVSPDGRFVVVGNNDGTAKLWDVEKGRCIWSWAHGTTADVVAFSADGRFVATGCDDGTAKLWDVESGRYIRTFGPHRYNLKGLAFSPDGTRLLTAPGEYEKRSIGPDETRLWDLESGREIRRFEKIGTEFAPVAFSPDGTRFAAGGQGKVDVWDVNSGERVRTLGLPQYRHVLSVAYSPDGARLFVCVVSSRGFVFTRVDFLYVWDSEWRLVSGATHPGKRFVYAYAAAFSRDGHWLAVAGGDHSFAMHPDFGDVCIWDLEAQKPTDKSFRHNNEFLSVAFSPDARWIATAAKDGAARIWSTGNQPALPPLDEQTIAPYIPGQLLLAEGFGGRELLYRRQINSLKVINRSDFFVIPVPFAEKMNISNRRSVHPVMLDMDGDGEKEIVVALGPGGLGTVSPSMILVLRDTAQQVQVIRPNKPVSITSKGAFSPSASNPQLRNPHGALNLAAGNFVEDELPMIIAAQGLGGNNQIRVFQYVNAEGKAKLKMVGQFQGLTGYAAQTNDSGGTAVAAGDVDGDGLDELLVGQMNSNTPEPYSTLFQVLDLHTVDGQVKVLRRTRPVAAMPWGFRGLGGVNLAVGDIDGDGEKEILASTAGIPDGANNPAYKSFVQIFDVTVDDQHVITAIRAKRRQPVQVFDADQNPSGGVDIAAGNLDLDPADELLVGTQAIISLDDTTGEVTYTHAAPAPLVKGLDFRFDENGTLIHVYQVFPEITAFVTDSAPASGAVNVEVYPAD